MIVFLETKILNTNKKGDVYMNEYLIHMDYNSDNDSYSEFEEGLKISFNKAISGGKKLFKTNVENLYEIYINNLPERSRQHYTCHACRHFINRFGGLVTIDEDGVMDSVMWDEQNTPPFFVQAVSALKQVVLNSKVNGVFIPDSKILGTPRTGEWTHLSVDLPKEMIHRTVLKNAYQTMAEKREDFRMLTNALLDYSVDTVNQALVLLQSETLYRSQRVLGVAEWFKTLQNKWNNTHTSDQKTNLVWLAVATAPAGFCHIRSSMIGTLLDDIKEGMSARVVAARFAEKMNPSNYMRSQSAPSANAIMEAEKIVEKLGIANSLQRRYATYEEIPTFLWQNCGEAKAVQQQPSGVFGHLVPKKQSASVMNLPTKVMTWEKFQRTVLPTAENIEVLIDNSSRFMALVTSVDETAENILQWDNTFSWYYHGGIDGEIRRRVEEAGGRYENNEIRVSLIWEGYTDLDLHCITPKGEHIYYGHKNDTCRGYLDVDANGGRAQTLTPVENIRWANNAPEGRYRFYVHNYQERGKGTTPYKVELEVNGQIYAFNGVASSTGYKEDVFVFDYLRGKQPTIKSASDSSYDSWGVQTNSFVKVKGITTSPNLWCEKPIPQSGTHIFFLLEGVKDTSEGKGRGFFNETLKSELREIRKTLEAYTANTPIQGADEATGCGVGYMKDNEWNLTVKVTSGNVAQVIKIDRWD